MILDDYVEVYNTQKNNCVVAKEFCYFNNKSEEEDFLVKLTEMLREHVVNNNNDGESQFQISPTVKLINSTLS